jgi:hypothetical protein
MLSTEDNGIFGRQIMIKLTTGNNKQSTSERKTLINNLQGNYTRRTDFIISSSTLSSLFSYEYATPKK